MGGKTLSTSATRIESLQLQSSAYGVTISLAYGVTRVPAALLDYRNFIAVPHTTSQGGKGGVTKMKSTDYTYTADAVMALARGPVTGVLRIWRGNEVFPRAPTATGGLLTTEETFVVPADRRHTLAHGDTFAGVVSLLLSMPDGEARFVTSEVVDGVLIIGRVAFFGGDPVGATATVRYQFGLTAGDSPALAELGLSLKSGTTWQQPWTGLAGAGEHELGYTGLALLCGQAYDLGSTAQMGNHNAEIVAPLAYHLGAGIPDVDTSLAVRDLLGNASYGAGLTEAALGDWTRWSDWCVAAGLLSSPEFTEQVKASDVLELAGQLTNTAPVFTGGKLQMVPLADGAASGHGRTFTPDVTPVYLLDDDCFVEPLKQKSKAPADLKNHVRVEYLDRSNSYSPAIAEAKDQADIDAKGLRTADVVQAHWVKDATTARLVAQLLLQRSLYVAAEYTGPLPWHYALLDPADLVSVVDPGLGMADPTPLRVTVIEENDEGDLNVTFEDYPAGTAGAPRYTTQQPNGYRANYNVDAGNAAAPLIFELPGLTSATGVEIAIAATGASAGWGGCQVWLSMDGTNYRLAGTLTGGSRMGTLATACAVIGGPRVTLADQQQLNSGSAADAAALNTLCFVRDLATGAGEFLAHETAQLVGVRTYQLGGTVVRGAYGTTPAAHLAGSAFARVDDNIARSGALDPSYIGKTIRVKLCSFNAFGGGVQSLADVAEYSYTVTGALRYAGDGAMSAAHSAGAAAGQAQQAAAAAAAAASLATTELVKMSADNILSTDEKPRASQEWFVLTDEKSGIDAQADAYGITTEKAAYDGAVAALGSYLVGLSPGWTDTTQHTPLDPFGGRAAWQAAWRAVYAARQALLNKVAALANNTLAGVGGGNLLVNPSFIGGVIAPWHIGYTNASGLALAVWGDGTYRLNGNETAFVHIPGTQAGAIVDLEAEALAVSPDRWYQFSALVDLHRAGVELYVMYLSAADAPLGYGGFPGSSYAGLPANGANPSTWKVDGGNMGWGNVEANYRRLFATFQPPAGCTHVRLVVRVYQADGASDGYCFLARAMACEVAPNTAVAVPFDMGAAYAKKAADDAQVTANAVTAAAAAIAADGILSADEKPDLILRWNVLSAERSGIDAQADSLGVSRADYDDKVNALAVYLSGMSPSWSDATANTDLAPYGGRSVFLARWGDALTAKQSVLNAIAAAAAQRASWAGVSGRPATFRVGAVGLGALGAGTNPIGANLYDAETMAVLLGGASMYRVATIHRTQRDSSGGLVVTDCGGFNTLSGPAGSVEAMIAALNAITGTDKIVVVWTYDEPATNRPPDLIAAMCKHGASRAVFGSARFQYRGAYVLVGIANCGDGNAFESYQGSFNSDPNAWCDVAFQIVNGALIVTGTGATARTLADYGYTGDMNATVGAPAGTMVAGKTAGDVAGATGDYTGQVKQITLGGSRTTFYPVLITSEVVGGSAYYDVVVSRPSVHQDGTWTGSYTCHIYARAGAWGNAPPALVEVDQVTGSGTYTSGVSNVYAYTAAGGIVVMLRGGMTHIVSVSQPIGGYTITAYEAGYADGLVTIAPETSGTLLDYLNQAYCPSAPLATNSLSLGAATDVLVATAAAYTVGKVKRPTSTDNEGNRDTVLALTYTPSVDTTASLFLAGMLSYTVGHASGWGGLWGGLNISGQWSRFNDTIGAYSWAGVNYTFETPIMTTKRFALAAGVTYTFIFSTAKWDAADTGMLSNLELRLEAIKR